MSELWTPPGASGPAAEPDAVPGADGATPSAEEVAALRQLHDQLRATPVLDVLANHVLGIWQLGLVHLGVATPPGEHGEVPAPDLAAAALAIDAAAALVDGLGHRLGDYEATLRDAVTQAQMLFVEVSERADR
ncbi:MAG: hypothetical protein ACT4OX_12430 [Actinomycetota bacterium]